VSDRLRTLRKPFVEIRMAEQDRYWYDDDRTEDR
jgi:hypothetical protein